MGRIQQRLRHCRVGSGDQETLGESAQRDVSRLRPGWRRTPDKTMFHDDQIVMARADRNLRLEQEACRARPRLAIGHCADRFTRTRGDRHPLTEGKVRGHFVAEDGDINGGRIPDLHCSRLTDIAVGRHKPEEVRRRDRGKVSALHGAEVAHLVACDEHEIAELVDDPRIRRRKDNCSRVDKLGHHPLHLRHCPAKRAGHSHSWSRGSRRCHSGSPPESRVMKSRLAGRADETADGAQRSSSIVSRLAVP
jgi:hypothetical protein